MLLDHQSDENETLVLVSSAMTAVKNSACENTKLVGRHSHRHSMSLTTHPPRKKIMR
jgi:hypothetical protein